MADYYTQYSAEIDKLTDDEIDWLEVRLKDIEEARANDDGLGEDDHDLGQVELGDRTLWFCARESGDPQAVAVFVQGFLKRFRPNGTFSMEHTFSCSRPRLDGFGGGAIFVTAERIEHLDTFAWVSERCREHEKRVVEHTG